jgi:hypothetical protein
MLFISFNVSAQTALEDSAKVFIKEVNSVRSNPKAFKDFLVSYASKKVAYKSGIGLDAFKEAVLFLDTVKPVDTLIYCNDIYRSISDHTGIDTITGVVKHDGKCLRRIVKYNKSFKTAGENFILLTKKIVIGKKTIVKQMSMKEALAEFIIDITMYNQGEFRGSHRTAIFNRKYKFTAVKLINVKGEVYLFQEFAGY